MEAVGLAASIIAIVQLGKMLNDAAASLVGQVCMSCSRFECTAEISVIGSKIRNQLDRYN
jgi:hypothetical protein